MSTTINSNLPILSNEGGLSAYLEQIKKFPMLDAEEEYMLAKNWKTTGNIKAAEKLNPISSFICTCPTPSSSYSTGSSAVKIFK